MSHSNSSPTSNAGCSNLLSASKTVIREIRFVEAVDFAPKCTSWGTIG